MIRSLFLNVAENHDLGWTLGCICGVRTGLMEWISKRQAQHLTWGDTDINGGNHMGISGAKERFPDPWGAKLTRVNQISLAEGN